MADSPINIIDAEFVAEARDLAGLLPAGPPEIAIAGRSNVGKSTLLNRIAGRKALARVSKTPGRTRGLVLFDLQIQKGGIRRPVRLVDLPGYGYAQVSHDERNAWQVLVEGYVKRQTTLALMLILVDARRQIAGEEMQLLEWLQGMHVPAHFVITKADKLGASERGLLRQEIRKGLGPLAASVSLASGQTGEGVDAIWARISYALDAQKGDSDVGSG
jgi:GTP-binding protein